MFHKILKTAAPVFALALAAGLTGCNSHVSINGEDGVPLAELDLAGKTPTEVVLAGPDDVLITQGDALTIDVSGDPAVAEALRFTLDDNSLGVMRKNGWKGSGKATVRVTLPQLAKLTVAGSGTVEADRLSGAVDATIAGSGTARVRTLDADKLDVTIAGSGTLEAAGAARTLDLNLIGSGSAPMSGLKVGAADVTIAGSGNAAFASDGTVKANVMGSGEVTVTGSAKCTIQAMGSGKLNCSAGTANSGSGPAAAPVPPTAPSAPGASGTPE